MPLLLFIYLVISISLHFFFLVQLVQIVRSSLAIFPSPGHSASCALFYSHFSTIFIFCCCIAACVCAFFFRFRRSCYFCSENAPRTKVESMYAKSRHYYYCLVESIGFLFSVFAFFSSFHFAVIVIAVVSRLCLCYFHFALLIGFSHGAGVACVYRSNTTFTTVTLSGYTMLSSERDAVRGDANNKCASKQWIRYGRRKDTLCIPLLWHNVQRQSRIVLLFLCFISRWRFLLFLLLPSSMWCIVQHAEKKC